jgi:low temperature requirement protein LtrA
VTTRRERWARLRRSLWQPLRPHGEQPRERVVGPLELFYDLAVVVLVAQAAHRLALHLTWPGLGEFAAVFTLVWIAWANGSLHHELHGHEDARARSSFLLQILVLIAMGAFIPQAGGSGGAGFAAAAGILFAVLTGLWLLAARGDRPEYRRASQLFVTGTALAVGLVAVVVGFGAWWTYFDFAGGHHPRPERTASLRWVLGHLPLTAAVAAMGAAMVSLVDHAHDGRTPAATAWILCAGAAVAPATTHASCARGSKPISAACELTSWPRSTSACPAPAARTPALTVSWPP